MGERNRVITWLGAVTVFLAVARTASAAYVCVQLPNETKEVKVKMVAVLASTKHNKIDPKLKCLARQITKLHPELTGFRIATTECKTIPVEGTEKFKLVVDQQAIVTILKSCEKKKCIQVKIVPPKVGTIVYTTKCKNYFPIMTRYVTKSGELLIIAVSVQPCKE